MRSERRSTGQILVAAALVLAVVATTAVAGVLLNRSQKARREAITERFDGRQTNASRFIEAYVAQVIAQEKELAEHLLTGSVSAARFDEIVTFSHFNAAVLLDGRGELLAVSPNQPALLGRQIGARYAHLQSAVAGRAAVSDVVPSASQGDPVVGFAVPFDTPGGRRVFSGAYAIAVTPLQPFVVSALSTYRSAHVYLVDSVGTIVSTDRPEQVGFSLAAVDAPLAGRITGTRSGFLARGANERHYVSGLIEGTPWRLIFTVDSARMFATYPPSERYAQWAALAGFMVMALGLVGLFVRAVERQAQAEDERTGQQTILETTADAYVGMDAAGLVTDWNTAAARLLGWSRSEALGQPVATLMVPLRDRDAHSAGVHRFLVTGIEVLPRHPITLSARHRSGHEIPVELTISRSHWRNTWHFHGFLRDITDRLRAEQQLQDLALTDSLTGLANRRAFLERLEQAHARARRHGTRLVVLFADVDHFKRINDAHGHAAGDAILCDVAHRLRMQFRTEDTIGRLGGDEFAVACEDLNIDPEELAERLRNALALPYSFRDEAILATVSVGYAADNPDDTAEQVLEHADARMYQAKATHRP